MSIQWYAGVGSRETPIDIWKLMYEVGFYMPFLGWGLTSGGAVKQKDAPADVDSADDAFYRGALASPALNPATMLRIYLINAFWEHYKVNPAVGLLNSLDYPETWEQAKQIMERARGSLNGLKDAGLKLHTRNVYQVLGYNLKEPVRQVICYARPVGSKGQYKGGTNTAIQIAKQADIPVMNLYHDEDRLRVEKFVEACRDKYANEIMIA